MSVPEPQLVDENSISRYSESKRNQKLLRFIKDKKPNQDLNPTIDDYEPPAKPQRMTRLRFDDPSGRTTSEHSFSDHFDAAKRENEGKERWARNIALINGDCFRGHIDKDNIKEGVILTES